MSEWHPLLLLTEPSPGVWLMKLATDYVPFGRIEIRRVQDEVRYRVQFKDELIGWASSLRVAAERLWREYLEDGRTARSGPPNVRGK